MRFERRNTKKLNQNEDDFVLISENGQVLQQFSEVDEDPFMSKDVKMVIPSPNCVDDEEDGGMMSLVVGTEIRKDSIWEIQIKFDTRIIEKYGFSNLILLNHRKNTKLKEYNMNDYYIDLKVRSKLLRDPIRELPFEKVGNIMNDIDSIEVHKESAVVKVKFTKRPRTVFHKQSDIMILIATLKKGDKRISSTAQELIFRGGTGSLHSAEKKKKSRKNFKPEVIKPNGNEIDSENPYFSIIQNNNFHENVNFENISNISYFPENMENNMQFPYPGNENISQLFPDSYNGYYAQPYQQEIDVDSKSIIQDFWLNKGHNLPGFEDLERPKFLEQNDYQPISNDQDIFVSQPLENYNETQSSPQLTDNQNQQQENPQTFPLNGFSFSVNGSSFKDGKFQATIEGVFFDKLFSGTLLGSINNEGFQGSFNSKFN